MFAAIRRASSFVGGLAAERLDVGDGRPQTRFHYCLDFPILRFAAESDLFELANDFSSLS